MKKLLVVSLLVGAAAAASAQTSTAPAPATAPTAQAVDLAKFKMALSEGRRKLFAAGMSNLSASQLETFWAVYADFEKEKDALTSARMDLARKYVENFATLSDADINKMATQVFDDQKKTIDLRVKYFNIYSAKLNVQSAGRFALIDDYITTAMRLQLLDHMPLLGDAAAAQK